MSCITKCPFLRCDVQWYCVHGYGCHAWNKCVTFSLLLLSWNIALKCVIDLFQTESRPVSVRNWIFARFTYQTPQTSLPCEASLSLIYFKNSPLFVGTEVRKRLPRLKPCGTFRNVKIFVPLEYHRFSAVLHGSFSTFAAAVRTWRSSFFPKLELWQGAYLLMNPFVSSSFVL
jgi:hypothetical protein